MPICTRLRLVGLLASLSCVRASAAPSLPSSAQDLPSTPVCRACTLQSESAAIMSDG